MATYELTIEASASAITASQMLATPVRLGREATPSVMEEFDDKTINIDQWGQTGWFWLTGFPIKFHHPAMVISAVPVIPPFSHPVELTSIEAAGLLAPDPIDPYKDGLRLYLHI